MIKRISMSLAHPLNKIKKKYAFRPRWILLSSIFPFPLISNQILVLIYCYEITYPSFKGRLDGYSETHGNNRDYFYMI